MRIIILIVFAQKIILDSSNKISDAIQKESFLKEQIFNKKVLYGNIID